MSTSNCTICGGTVRKYTNPDREVCDGESKHAGILAKQRSSGTSNRGQPRPKSKDNLPKKKDPPKKK